MSFSALSFTGFFDSYKQWVSKNPQLASDVESTVKWVSYFVAGRINNSSALSELIYSLSNLLVLFNDRIIHDAKNIRDVTAAEKLKIWLTVLEYSEVFIEVTARKRWGSTGKWSAAVLLQLIKCAAKLSLLFYYKEKIIQSPPVPPLKRTSLNDDQLKNETKNKLETTVFTLRRCGKVMRRVNGAPPVHGRSWRPPAPLPTSLQDIPEVPSSNTGLPTDIAVIEAAYVLKPLVHLWAMWHYGPKSWKPWTLSLCIDILSLYTYRRDGRGRQLTRQQRLEVSRRALSLVLYILRSPFYERHSRDRLQAFLLALAKCVPLAGTVCVPLAHYLPQWQDTYFYVWSS